MQRTGQTTRVKRVGVTAESKAVGSGISLYPIQLLIIQPRVILSVRISYNYFLILFIGIKFGV